MPDTWLISVVEDDDSAREALAGLVRAFGYLTAAFCGAAEFLQSNLVAKTACLIADVHMPRMSGLDLHLFLVASGIAIPTLLVTAFPDDAGRRRALDLGVAGYLVKPVSPETLLTCIQDALKARH